MSSNAAAETRAASRVTIIGMILDLVLGAVKTVGGVLFQSQALLVDGIHSFSDAATDVVVLGVMRVSRQGPDTAHPYGHQRFETLGTMLLGTILIAVAGALAWDNLSRLLFDRDELLTPQWPVLVAALLSVVGKEWIYRYTLRVGNRINSSLLKANAWHSRTDAISSVLVILSTLGAMMGYVWLDAVAAVAIAVIVGRIGWEFAWDSVQELVDTGLSEEDTQQIRTLAESVEGVKAIHELRSRRMGHDVLLDVHLLVAADISVSEGHQIGMRVVEKIRQAYPAIKDILFHVDPENDANGIKTSPDLPSRHALRTELEAAWGHWPEHTRVKLHYLGNQVTIEVFLPAGVELSDHDIAAAQALPSVAHIRVWHPR